MNKYQKNIYKIHIKQNRYPVFLYWVAFAVLISVTFLWCGHFLKTEQETFYAKKTMGYSYVIESSEFNSGYFPYYKLGNLVPIKNGKNVVYSNFYVQMTSQSDIAIYKENLGVGEIAISQKIADRLNINIGQSIEVLLPTHDEATIYTVVDVLPYVDDYYDFEDDYDFSVALVGYDESLESHAKGEYVGFFIDDGMKEYMTEKLSYTKMYYVAPELEQSQTKLVITNIVLSVVVAVAFVFYSMLVNVSLKTEWKKYFVEGISLRFLRKLILLDKLIFVSTLGIAMSVLMLSSSMAGIVRFSFASSVSLLYFAIVAVNIFWRDNYGKAS